jgi:hypothetical protein
LYNRLIDIEPDRPLVIGSSRRGHPHKQKDGRFARPPDNPEISRE